MLQLTSTPLKSSSAESINVMAYLIHIVELGLPRSKSLLLDFEFGNRNGPYMGGMIYVGAGMVP